MEAKLTTIKSDSKKGSTRKSEPPSTPPLKKRIRTAAKEAYWSAIPDDILCLVAEKIHFLEEYVTFSAVCRLWYQFSADYYNGKKKFEFVTPFFMQKEEKVTGGDRISSQRTFYSYSSRRSFPIDLPETTGRRCWGSPFGWMVTFNPNDLQFCLLNPFTRALISLPSIRTLISVAGDYNLRRQFVKAFLTASPDESNCLVFVVLNPAGDVANLGNFVLGFTKPGIDTSWTRIDGHSDLNDIISFEGNLYGVRRLPHPNRIMLVLILIQQPAPRVVEFASPKAILNESWRGRDLEMLNDISDYASWKYLVELDGELCLVLRYVDSDFGLTRYFKVFKIDVSTKKWSRIHPRHCDQQGSHCFFIGNNYSFTCKANVLAPSFDDVKKTDFKKINFKKIDFKKTDFRKTEGPPQNFIGNHVFFSHDCSLYVLQRDEGVFDLLTSRVVDSDMDLQNLNQSLWITPSIRFSHLKYSRNQEDHAGSKE